MFQEFKEFAMKGNVLDLAIGLVLGVAFKDIVSSFVSDIIMPPIGMLLGGVNFSDLFITLDGGTYATLSAAEEAGAVVISYGAFVNTIIDFVIIAFAIFIVVKQINRFKKEEESEPETEPEPSNEEKLLIEIRDALQSNL